MDGTATKLLLLLATLIAGVAGHAPGTFCIATDGEFRISVVSDDCCEATHSPDAGGWTNTGKSGCSNCLWCVRLNRENQTPPRVAAPEAAHWIAQIATLDEPALKLPPLDRLLIDTSFPPLQAIAAAPIVLLC